MKKLIQIFKLYKNKLIPIYILMVLSEIVIVYEPYVLGKSVDGMLNHNYSIILLLLLMYLTGNVLNYKRMVIDTKVYTTMYNNIVLDYLSKSNEEYAVKAARTEMAYGIVGVFEGYIHYYISTIITVVGAAIFVFNNNYQVGLIMSIATVFIIYSVLKFYKKVNQVNFVRNNHYELRVQAIKDGLSESINFFSRHRKLLILDSNLQGASWFSNNMIRDAFLLCCLVCLVMTSDKITAGEVLSVYAYVSSFLSSLMSVTTFTEVYARIKDTLNRLDNENIH